MHDGAHAAPAGIRRSGRVRPQSAGAAVLFRRSEVVELVVLAAIAFTAFIVIGVLLSVFSVVGWFLWLPFKILGWALRLIGLVFAFPFILIACLLGGFGILLGAGVLVIPLLPLFLLFGGLWWLLFRRRGPAPSQARIV
jgi:hypothetical protein